MGQALWLILVNLGLSFAIPNVSIGGHIGGLVGGVVAMIGLTLTRYRRPRYLGPAFVVLIGVASVVIAVARAKNYA